ncbi:MAG: hypothetical protein D4R67_05905 [Bacteroidetes bacterium]|nr:MAG: hypothetical protein D4R67_05905 [Bacteroidota bacterium]
MEKSKKITDQVSEVLIIQSEKFSSENGYSLSEVYRKLEKHGLSSKSEFTLPLQDTIGRTFHEQIRMKCD